MVVVVVFTILTGEIAHLEGKQVATLTVCVLSGTVGQGGRSGQRLEGLGCCGS